MNCAAVNWLRSIPGPKPVRLLLQAEFCGECEACSRDSGGGDWWTPGRNGRSQRVRREAVERDSLVTQCFYCGRAGDAAIDPDGKVWHWDHLIPLSRGGKDHADNLAKTCQRCNLRKNARTDAEFFEVLR